MNKFNFIIYVFRRRFPVGILVHRTVLCTGDIFHLPALAIFLLSAMALLWAISIGSRTLRSQFPGGNTTVSSRNSFMAVKRSSRDSALYATS